MQIKNHGLQWLLATGISLTCWLHGGLAMAAVGLSETAPPAVIKQLATVAAGSPQVTVLSPRPDEVVTTNNVAVNLQVQGTPIFKNAALGLGPHLHLLLDRTPYQSVYDLAQPLILNNLTPGTHTLQVLLAKPWHESWKNPGAFAQVTFHVLAKSAESPAATIPTLVYNEPDDTYGAEPVLLDFYLANAPSHLDAQQHLVNDWRVRTTINDQSFEVNQLSPFYLKGLKPGANLVKMEYLNAQGQPLDSILRVVNYQPNGTDSLSRLLRNELALNDALALFNPASKKEVVAIAPAAPAVPNPQLAWPPAPPVIIPPAPPLNPPPMAAIPSAPVMAVPVLPPPAPVPIPSAPPVLPSPSLLAPLPLTIPVPAIPAPLNSGFNYQVKPLPLPAPAPPQPSPLPSATIPVPVAPPTPAISLKLPVVELPPVIKPNLPLEKINELPPRDLPPATLSDRSPAPALPMPNPVLKAPIVEKSPAEIPEMIPSKAKELIDRIPPPPAQTPLLNTVNGESEIEFKVLAREFFHTASVRIKKFTNSIPPQVAQWSKDLSHWIGDRSQAMQARQQDVSPERS